MRQGLAPVLLMVVLVSACDDAVDRPPAPCTRDADCALPELCGVDGLCAKPDPVEEGETCQHDEHCLSQICVERPDLDQGAVCSTPCDEPDTCKPGQICAPTLATPVQPADGQDKKLLLLCVAAGSGELYQGEPCSSDEQCRSGLCHKEECTQPCGTCPVVATCEEQTLSREGLTLQHDLCIRQPPLRIVELGPVDTPQSGAQELTFDIDAGVQSFVLFARDEDGLAVGIRRLTGPDGTVIIDQDNPEAALMRGFVSLGVATALVPGSDQPGISVKEGSYKVLLGTFDTEDLTNLVTVDGTIERVALITRRLAGSGGLLDLNIHLAPGTGLVAESAQDNAYLRDTLTRLDDLYRTLMGVSVGEVRYSDLTEAEDIVETAEQGRQIISTYGTGNPNGQSINLFIVEDLTFAGGFTGGIPGTPGTYGHPASGTVLERYSNASVMGTLMAHEIGHLIGLWHTTEPGAVITDYISDTPECPLNTVQTDCPDYRNLMFPFFPTNDPLFLSEGQVSVARGSPWLYEVAYPDMCKKGVYGSDLYRVGFASGTTAGKPSAFSGGCGGASHGERVHLYRLRGSPLALEIRVEATGFTPVVYVRKAECSDESSEIACVAGDASEPEKTLPLTLEAPQPGAYYLFVDGLDGGGRYTLRIWEQYEPPPP